MNQYQIQQADEFRESLYLFRYYHGNFPLYEIFSIYLVAIPYNANIKTKHKISIKGSNMRSVNCLVSYEEARKQNDVFMVLYLVCSYTLGY